MQVDRTHGCLLGQIAGDALAALSSSSRRKKSVATTRVVFGSCPMAAPGILLRGSQQMTQKWR